MNRREFLLQSSLGLWAAGALSRDARAAEPPAKQPNIVLIMADDMGYEALGCYGSASYQTPVLDTLAAEGIRFDRCHAQPLCTPSRVRLMTGRSNFRNYVEFGVLDPKEKTFAHTLRDAGYATLVAGKWQLLKHREGQAPKGSRPEQAGFDDYCLWQLDKREERYADPLVQLKGEPPTPRPGEYGPDIFCDYIEAFITQHQTGPFLVYFPMCLTHAPYQPTPDSAEWKEGDRHQKDDKFFAHMVAYTDKCVGRIVKKLEALGLRENTLILFIGDNGTGRGISSKMTDGRIVEGGKGYTTDAGTHVPFIANWPGHIPPRQVCDDLITFDDFLPTLADLTRAPLPKDTVLDGRSFAPQLCGEKGEPREWAFCFYDARQENGKWPKSRFAHTKEWKLYDDGRFYHLAADLQEKEPIPPDAMPEAARPVYALLQGVLEKMQ